MGRVLTQVQLAALAAFGSAVLIIAAFAFQHVGGLAPCQMCIWQRYPHVLAIGIGLLVVLSRWTPLLLVGAVAAASTAGIGFYHAGVEQGWWQGPATCSAGDISGMSADALLDQILAAPLVRCDEIPWEMLGLSMAAWNGLISLGLFGIWLRAYWRT